MEFHQSFVYRMINIKEAQKKAKKQLTEGAKFANIVERLLGRRFQAKKTTRKWLTKPERHGILALLPRERARK